MLSHFCTRLDALTLLHTSGSSHTSAHVWKLSHFCTRLEALTLLHTSGGSHASAHRSRSKAGHGRGPDAHLDGVTRFMNSAHTLFSRSTVSQAGGERDAGCAATHLHAVTFIVLNAGNAKCFVTPPKARAGALFERQANPPSRRAVCKDLLGGRSKGCPPPPSPNPSWMIAVARIGSHTRGQHSSRNGNPPSPWAD